MVIDFQNHKHEHYEILIEHKENNFKKSRIGFIAIIFTIALLFKALLCIEHLQSRFEKESKKMINE